MTNNSRLPSSTVVGYLRVSTADQDLEKNKADILHLANNHDLGRVHFVEEKISGKVSWRNRKRLAVALRGLVERTSLDGRLRCDFQSANIPEKSLPPRVQHELLRIAQEAIHNAVRHGNPTLIAVSLLWDAPNLVLQVKDNGSGMSRVPLHEHEGFGLNNMRARASQIDAKMEIQTAAGHGTSLTVAVPITL
jgi:signal transduction histidine kinase